MLNKVHVARHDSNDSLMSGNLGPIIPSEFTSIEILMSIILAGLYGLLFTSELRRQSIVERTLNLKSDGPGYNDLLSVLQLNFYY